MHPSAKTIVWTAAKFAVPVAIITWLGFFHIDWAQLSLQPKNYALLACALIVALCGVSLSFARWCMLVRCQGISLSMVEAFRISSICYLFNFISAGSVGGDLFKAIFLAKRRPGRRIEAVASVFVDRGVGLFGLVLLVAIAMWVADPPGSSDENRDQLGQIKLVAAVLVGVGTVVLSVLVFGGKGVDRLVRWGSRLRWVGPLIGKVGAPLRMFHRHPIAFFFAIVMSLGVHTLLVISMYLIAKSLYLDPPTLLDHFVIVPIGMLAAALPITPAGLGVYEAAIEWLYRIIPATKTTASGTLVALVFEIVKVVMAVIGTLFYWTANAEERESIEAAEHVETKSS
ncbi:hypothetical protein CA13_38940 [Planctomycetes bacterium CA13]|uniref:Uncharacterized protein n=1 Tax=Novipirellula herctigrandis TaxID=2527986 RepID=A0A5C5Z6I7_9BACT|nr:hypothetical protein CA13_38940 [Planctomycetes bacterium CA13]